MERKTERLGQSARGDAALEGFTEAEILDRLEAALESLPRHRREIFLAARRDAMPYDEIARMTGLSVRKVERELARALLQIDEHLRRGEVSSHHSWWQRFWRS